MRKVIILVIFCICICAIGGCSSNRKTLQTEKTNSEEGLENEIEDIADLDDIEMESLVNDDWPERIGRKTSDMTAKELMFDIQISKPMTIVISCSTEKGKLGMKIQNASGKTYFNKNNLKTEKFYIDIDKTGTYTVTVQSKDHTGSFWLKPKK